MACASMRVAASASAETACAGQHQQGVAIETAVAAHLLQAYRTYNEIAVELGRSRGHFLVDLCRPGHMTACLRTFQETIHCNDDNWDAHFGALPFTVAARNPLVLQQ